jgi:menaquinol-cytochrome c reductase iron-sulfur subunit
MNKSSQNPPRGAQSATPAVQRRSFLREGTAIVVGGIVALVPAIAGLVAFLDPLRRKNRAAKFVRVATLDSLPDDGVPRQFPVITERVDAWNRSIEPIGMVYLRRQPGQQTVECWSATCPHAGCIVDFDEQANTYKCPCHNSSFEVNGQIIPPSPSPRDMDSLNCQVDQQAILVKFENFYSGRTEKVIKT